MPEKKTEVIDGERVEVIRTTPMTVTPMETVDLVAHGQTDRGIALFEERTRNAKRMLAVALKLTTPGQWMVYGEGDKRSVYATAGAAERILRHGFGMRWGVKKVTVDTTDEAVIATCNADLLTAEGHVYERFLGTRRGEFRDDGDIKGYLKNEQDLIKGAIANMKHRAVHALMGLAFMTPEDFKEMGLDLDKLTRKVEFQTHSQNAAELTVPFGKNKGKHPRELADKSLEWYLNNARETVANPAKAKWRAKNQLWLDALELEKARRGGSAPTVQEVSEGVQKDGPSAPPPAEAEADDGLPAWDENPEVEGEG